MKSIRNFLLTPNLLDGLFVAQVSLILACFLIFDPEAFIEFSRDSLVDE